MGHAALRRADGRCHLAAGAPPGFRAAQSGFLAEPVADCLDCASTAARPRTVVRGEHLLPRAWHPRVFGRHAPARSAGLAAHLAWAAGALRDDAARPGQLCLCRRGRVAAGARVDGQQSRRSRRGSGLRLCPVSIRSLRPPRAPLDRMDAARAPGGPPRGRPWKLARGRSVRPALRRAGLVVHLLLGTLRHRVGAILRGAVRGAVRRGGSPRDPVPRLRRTDRRRTARAVHDTVSSGAYRRRRTID